MPRGRRITARPPYETNDEQWLRLFKYASTSIGITHSVNHSRI